MSKYAEINQILNEPPVLMSKFWIWQSSEYYASIRQCPEYVRIWLDTVMDISHVLNMPGFWIYKSPKYATIWLNITE